MTKRSLTSWTLAAVAIAAIAGATYYTRGGARQSPRARPAQQAGAPLQTGRAELATTRLALERQLAADPGDTASAVRYADLALREIRVTANAGLAKAAEQALRAAIEQTGPSYEAERMLTSVLLSQHRFREATLLAERLARLEPADAWLQGAIGDAALEMGEYDRAFDAFDRMAEMRPDSSSYARVAYARELRGDLDGALAIMRMALDSASPHDLEAQAWYACEVGALLFELGRPAEARRAYGRALHAYPSYAPALLGQARVRAGEGDLAGATAAAREALAEAPSADAHALLGALFEASGDAAAATRHYALAEAGWMTEAPEPLAEAHHLATLGRRLDRARQLMDAETRSRTDIHTMDAAAWTAHAAGDDAAARRAIAEALRTGTRSRHIHYHAAAIAARAGDEQAARRHLDVALAGDLTFDVREAPAARALRETLDKRAAAAPASPSSPSTHAPTGLE